MSPLIEGHQLDKWFGHKWFGGEEGKMTEERPDHSDWYDAGFIAGWTAHRLYRDPAYQQKLRDRIADLRWAAAPRTLVPLCEEEDEEE
jgi:hypothetical protein